ncbi:probable trehalase isoform X2 [Andrographis paniculata]|uniref:probable trehalase isoform X2 n=1 Tax=Andrographis paniculata TaxID=175694 RepID=UPI0021E9179E|nr:probable trehalase isoform X2 [Andrographis paniculata]
MNFQSLLASSLRRFHFSSAVASERTAAACTGGGGPVVPTTPLVAFLERVQAAALQAYGGDGFDPKPYVDLSLKQNLSAAVEAFEKIPKSGAAEAEGLAAFLAEYTSDAEADLVHVDPADFVDRPTNFLPKVESPAVRAWALEVHQLWKNLSRKVSGQVIEKPDLHTLLPLPNPVIIPGSRFTEVYYWDSYWIIRGLLASKMYETAKGMVYNLISLIHKYGYVLNGARAYYTNRSQPPLLSSMVVDIYDSTQDKELVIASLPALLKEHHFWNSGIHKVTIVDSEGSAHTLSRYFAMWDQPRPESSSTDKETASKLAKGCARTQLYRELASTAESGWDFSTRWMRNESDLTTLATTLVIPVDLNAFILKMELDIISLATAIGDGDVAERFRKKSEARVKAINSVLWNAEKQQWFDYWLSDSDASKEVHQFSISRQNQKTFASNFIPLWIQPFNSDIKTVDKVVESLLSSGLVCAYGISTSLTNSSQQWDYPNGWAPLQHMIAEGLRKSGSEQAHRAAEDIAVKWIRTNYAAYKETGAMHEKYDVEKCGGHGGGGEYAPQTGFGWSNGVVLAFLEEFGWPNDRNIECSESRQVKL